MLARHGTGYDLSRIGWLYGHGVSMALAWCLLGMSAFFVAHFRRLVGARWFRIHAALAISSYCVGLVGLGCAVAFSGSLELSDPHHILGVVLFVMSTLQMGVGVLARFRECRFTQSRPSLLPRIHRFTGHVLVICALMQVYLGVTNDHLELASGFLVLFIVFVVNLFQGFSLSLLSFFTESSAEDE